VIFGTRPEAIKLAPLVRRMKRQPKRFRVVTIVTAQHREMLDQVLEVFHIEPDHDLDIIRPRQTLAGIAARAVAGLHAVLKRTSPDFVVVQGDTSTTFIGALAAFYCKIPVIHVEAGLRTRHKYQPFPEEINRQLTSVLADGHCAPTERARANLLAENVDPGRIWVTGNTVIDALHDVLALRRTCRHPALRRIAAEQARMILVTAHRRENQGEPMERICRAVLELVARHADVIAVFPVHLSPAVRDTVLPRLARADRVILMEPLSYFETAHFMKAAHLILTDSGGIQEEGPSLGKPVLVLRDVTERPEAVEAGTARLVGTETERIVAEAERLLCDRRAYRRMATAVNPYGDGRACERIMQAVDHMAGRAAPPPPFVPSRRA